jgi:GNAT superfamily N-acetyltransferase/ABC-type nitrate/sulfonate/bicarbonate transport system ATPase subunit
LKIEVRNRCSDFNSYRAARVKSLFNAESGCDFHLDAELPVEDGNWKIGLVVGPSGSGKTSLGRKVFGADRTVDLNAGWPENEPIIDAIDRDGDFNSVTAALSAVGLGAVPSWLRPFAVLSNGEKFRAGLARVICEASPEIVIDEFTSVVDRQIAKFGALAFQKAWRRTTGKAVLLSCHYDIIEWLEPDWVYDTATGQYLGRNLWRRPKFDLQIWKTDGRYWPLFEPHHYLKLPRMVAAEYYVGTVDGELVAHVATSPRFEINGMRACRLVVMPEWQGAGVGTRFLNAVCQHQLDGGNRWERKVRAVYFHTSHPGLCAALRRDKKWKQVSAVLFGGNKTKSRASIRGAKFAKRYDGIIPTTGYGGHFRAVQGFKYTNATEGAPV